MLNYLIYAEMKLFNICFIAFFVYLVIREVLAHENQR